jgi:2-dehydropantoate 2-reductase
MRIAVIGAGGIGGPFGVALAKAGKDVTFVARGAHLTAMRKNGLRIEGDRGETHIHPVQATDDAASIGVVDLVLFCVKLWDVETVGEQIRPMVGANTAVIPLQNGIAAAERLIPILGRAAVMGGTALVTGAIVWPGVVHQTGEFQRMTFGDLDGRRSARGERIRDLCQVAGFEGLLSEDIERAIWEKFNMLVAHSAVTALTRLPIGRLRDAQ